MSYNREFELDIDDIDIIEIALKKQLSRLSENRLTLIESTIKPAHEISSVAEIDEKIKQINNLLGKLHNQKTWFRPKGTYVGG